MPLEYRFTGVSRNDFDLREFDDLIEASLDLTMRHTQNGAVQEDVFTAGQFGMESRTHLEKAPHAADQFDPAGGSGSVMRLRIFNSVDFPSLVVADHAHRLALFDLERHVVQGVEDGAVRLTCALSPLVRAARRLSVRNGRSICPLSVSLNVRYPARSCSPSLYDFETACEQIMDDDPKLFYKCTLN